MPKFYGLGGFRAVLYATSEVEQCLALFLFSSSVSFPAVLLLFRRSNLDSEKIYLFFCSATRLLVVLNSNGLPFFYALYFALLGSTDGSFYGYFYIVCFLVFICFCCSRYRFLFFASTTYCFVSSPFGPKTGGGNVEVT